MKHPAKPQVLIVQHHEFAPAGVIGRTLLELGADLTVIDVLGAGHAPTDRAADFDGLVVLGGLMSAECDEEFPRITDLLELIREFHAQAKPFLGICLGAQLLARALGGVPCCGLEPEVGMTELSLTDSALGDPLMRGLPRQVRFMEVHEDSFTLPAAATLLMVGTCHENQAFRVGQSYGLQFHLEVDEPILRGWCRMLREKEPGEETERKIDKLMADVELYLDDHAKAAQLLTANWLDIVGSTAKTGAMPGASL